MNTRVAQRPRAPINDSIIIALARLVDDAQTEKRCPTHSEIEFQINRAGLKAGDPIAQGMVVGKAKRVRVAVLSWALTWLGGEIGKPKTKASGQPVVMGPLLADIMRQWQAETPYRKPQDWVFPSFKLRGRKPRTGSIMAQDYLRPAAVKAGILTEGDRRRFGFHNLRHSLASYLVTQTKTDIKTVQAMLRHADSGTTLDLYTHAINRDKLVAQNQVMEAMMRPQVVN